MSQYNVDEAVVKKPQDDEPLTEEQADEWVKCAQDKRYWMRNYAWVQTPKGKQLFDPRAYQDDMLDLMEDRFAICVSPRQSGKCCTPQTEVGIRIAINNGKEYNIKLPIGVVHEISKCNSPEEVECIIARYQSESTNEQIENCNYHGGSRSPLP